MISVNSQDSLRYGVTYSLYQGTSGRISNTYTANGTGNYQGSFSNYTSAIGKSLKLVGELNMSEPSGTYKVSGQFSSDSAS